MFVIGAVELKPMARLTAVEPSCCQQHHIYMIMLAKGSADDNIDNKAVRSSPCELRKLGLPLVFFLITICNGLGRWSVFHVGAVSRA